MAFLGLGAMGLPMAERLARAGFSVAAFGRSRRDLGSLTELGAEIAPTPREAARGATFVVSMLRDGGALRARWFGPDGAATEADGKLFLDMSTSGPSVAREAAAEIERRGGRFVDAPVSGTVGPAARGELVILAGGADEDLARAEPIFRVLGRSVVRAGAVGAGQALKVVLNGLGAQHLVAFATMLRLGERAGLSREVLVEAFTTGAFATPSYVSKRARVLARDYRDPDFSLSLTKKDAELCAELAREVGMEIPAHAAARNEIERAVAAGMGEDDLFGIERVYDENTRNDPRTTP